MIVFDIETGPLPLERIKEILNPYDSQSLGPHPGDFDPGKVKLGRMVDQEKIDAKIEASRKQHEDAVRKWESDAVTGEDRYWSELHEKAPLSAVSGEILAIGYCSSAGIHLDVRKNSANENVRSEFDMISDFWEKFLKCEEGRRKMVGHNIFGFDLPFLMRRGWILGTPPPNSILENSRWPNRIFVDTMRAWSATSYPQQNISLNQLGLVLGVGRKLEGVDGSMFHKLLENDYSKALEYLEQDLLLTLKVAEKMCI